MMCESTVVLIRNGIKEIIMEDVAKIKFSHGSVTLMDILGETRTVDNVKITEANLMDHELILEEI